VIFQQISIRMNRILIPRRKFLASLGRTAVVGSLASLDISRFAHAAGSGLVRLGLIGCGGRGTGAAHQALATGKDVRLVAMADLLEEKIISSLATISRAGVGSDQLQVGAQGRFVGFDAFQNLLASGVDAVILSTPPGFRPLHFEKAIAAGIHSFLEKPVAVDAPGVRQVRAAAQAASRKGLCALVGLQEHFSPSHHQLLAEVAKGSVGKINRLTATIRQTDVPRWMQRATLDKQIRRASTEMEFQTRNWYDFVWLSGDMIVEWLIHQLDTCVRAMGGLPETARGTAERREHTSSDYGNFSDFCSATYRFAEGVELLAEISGLSGATKKYEATIEGQSGIATVRGDGNGPNTITDHQGRAIWSYTGPKPDPYQEEMNQWCASIRNGKPLNTVSGAADSTLVAIMGRTAAYTGREITWTQIQQSNEAFFAHNPESFQDDPPDLPDKFGDYQSPPRGVVNGTS